MCVFLGWEASAPWPQRGGQRLQRSVQASQIVRRRKDDTIFFFFFQFDVSNEKPMDWTHRSAEVTQTFRP